MIEFIFPIILIDFELVNVLPDKTSELLFSQNSTVSESPQTHSKMWYGLFTLVQLYASWLATIGPVCDP